MPTRPNNTEFPYEYNIDTWKTLSTFDYSVWGELTTLQLYSVDWDSEYSNTVKFADEDARDAYMDTLPEVGGITIEQEYRIKFNGATANIRVALPFEQAVRANYLRVNCPPMPVPLDDEQPSQYYFFITAVTQIAPNTTELSVTLDLWQNYIYKSTIRSLQLARGHYPTRFTNVDTYLSNPVQNNEGLLEPELIVGDLTHLAFSQSYAPYHNDLMFCITGKGDLNHLWNYDDLNSNTNGHFNNPNGGWTIGCYIPAFPGDNIGHHLLDWIRNNHFNIYQSITSTFEVPRDVFGAPGDDSSTNVLNVGNITTGTPGPTNWGGIADVYMLQDGSNQPNQITLAKSIFNYPSPYNNIAKLYTSQYAKFRVRTHGLDSSELYEYGIDQSVGYITLNQYCAIQGTIAGSNYMRWHITGISQGTQEQFIHTFPHYVVEVSQQEAEQYYNQVERANSYSDNNDNLTIQLRDIQATRDNVQDDIIKAGIDNTNQNTHLQNNYNMDSDQLAQQVGSDSIVGSQKFKIEKQLQNSNNNIEANLAVGISGDIFSSIGTSVATQATKGSGGLTSAVGSAVNITAGIYTNGNIAGNNEELNSQNAEVEKQYLDYQTQLNIGNMNAHNNEDQSFNTINTNQTIATTTSKANRSQSTSIADANQSKQIADRDTGTPLQASIYKPVQGGDSNAQGSQHTLFRLFNDMNLVTANPDIIIKAGNSMLRYGYTYNSIIDHPIDLQVMPYFTYWECDDVIVNNSFVPSIFRDSLESIFINGVTVWSNPSDIRTISISNNWS